MRLVCRFTFITVFFCLMSRVCRSPAPSCPRPLPSRPYPSPPTHAVPPPGAVCAPGSERVKRSSAPTSRLRCPAMTRTGVWRCGNHGAVRRRVYVRIYVYTHLYIQNSQYNVKLSSISAINAPTLASKSATNILILYEENAESPTRHLSNSGLAFSAPPAIT